MVQYVTYVIFIFMNINENLTENKGITLDKLLSLGGGGGGNQTYIEHLGHFHIDANWLNETT